MSEVQDADSGRVRGWVAMRTRQPTWLLEYGLRSTTQRVMGMRQVTPDSSLGVLAMRPFLPARDFEVSFRFYTDLGFEPFRLGGGLASMHLGPFAFLLQDYYVKECADNFMMHLLVDDLNAWWARIASLKLSDRFEVQSPAEPKLQSWGLVVSYVWDPSGVLWHFAQDPQSVRPKSA